MTGRDDKAVASTPPLQEAWAILVRITGAIAGATGLTFGVGFVLVNLSLLKHGVYEGALVRERYVAAGISYLTVLAGAVLIAWAAYWLVDRLPKRWPRPVRILAVVALTPVMDYLLALLVWLGGRVPPKLGSEAEVDYLLDMAGWWLEGLRFFNVALLIWALAAGWLGLFLLYADRIRWAQEFLFRKAPLPTPPPQPPEPPTGPPQPPGPSQPATPQTSAPDQTTGKPEDATPQVLGRAQSPAYLTALGIVFFALLLTYGQYVYDTLPAALGGGLPVVVQFTGSEDKMAILAGMGVPLENPTITGQLELIGQTGGRYIVFVRQSEWERSPTDETRLVSHSTVLAFDKELVQGVRYYPSEYYLTDTFAAVKRIQEGDDLYDRGFYDAAIEKYEQAIDRRPDYEPAYFHRGQAYLSKARIAWHDEKVETARSEAAQAAADFERARDLNPGEADHWYYLAQAQALASQGKSAVESLSEAVNREPAYRDQALNEPLFEELKAQVDLDFGFESILFDSLTEAARAYAAEGQDRYAAAQEVEDVQVRREILIQATLAYSRAITLTPATDLPLEQAGYRAALAAIYQDRGLPDPAVIQLEQAVDTAPDNEGYRLRLARAYADQGRWDDAKDMYDEVLRLNEENASAWLGKGEILLQQAEHRKAAVAFQRASELAPGEVTAWYGLGVARLAFNPAEAEAPLRQAVTLDPTYTANIRQALRQAELETDVSEQLEAVLRAADEVVQGDAALETGDLAQAIDHYETATEADPDNIVYLVKLGDAYRKQGDEGAVEAYAQAAEIYRRLIDKVKDEPSYHFRLATVYAAQGEDADALIAYNTAISLDPDVAAYYAARARLYVRLGRTGDAIAEYDTAIRLDPNMAAYYAARAPLHVRLDRAGDAIADYEQAISLEPSNHLYHGQLGQLYYEGTLYDEAIAALTTATDLNPKYALGFYYLGLVHLTVGDADAARIAFATCTEVTQDEIQNRQCQEQLIPLATPTP